MRKLIFSLVLSVITLAGFSQTYEVTVHGTVTDDDSGNPVEGQAVEIMTDSMSGNFFYYNLVYTDSTGYYQDAFDAPEGEDGQLKISTMSCGEHLSETEEYSEDDSEVEVDFEVCGNPGGGGDECIAMFSHFTDDNDSLTIHFEDESWGDPNEWDWDFGDGNSSDEQDPVHTYDSVGMYFVSLTIEGDDDCEGYI